MIRRRRLELGLSQTELGRPFTRAYVSSLENGHCVPSLSALVLIAARLKTTTSALIDSVNPELSVAYNPEHAPHGLNDIASGP